MIMHKNVSNNATGTSDLQRFAFTGAFMRKKLKFLLLYSALLAFSSGQLNAHRRTDVQAWMSRASFQQKMFGKAEIIGSGDYYTNKSKSTVPYQIVKTIGNKVYIFGDQRKERTKEKICKS